jgi:hypothetical protein
MRLPYARFTVRRLMIIVALLGIAIGGLVLEFRPQHASLKLVNRSGQSISRLVVKFSTEQSVLTDLSDGSTTAVPFPVHDDVHFSVSGSLANGKAVYGAFRVVGDPKRFAGVACDILEDGGATLTIEPLRR